jgi:hypothetical protein
MAGALSRLATIAVDFGWLLGELLVLFLIVASGVALGARRLGVRRLRRALGGNRLVGALKGIALGFATPFCTYSAIPLLVAMLDTGVRTSTWLGFLLAAPVLDPLIAVAISVIFRPQAALAYTLATFAGVLAAAVIADAAGLEHRRARVGPPAIRAGHARRSLPTASASGESSCDMDPLPDVAAWQGWSAELRRAVRYAIDLIRGMAVPLIVAVAFAAAITGFVPQRLIVSLAGPDNLLAVPVAAVVGTPFYVSGEAFLPIAAALLDKGMSAGAVFALIIAGAGVNIPEIGLLSGLLDRRLLVVLVASVFAIATLAGYLIPTIT